MVAVAPQNLERAQVPFRDDASHFFVDRSSRGVAVIAPVDAGFVHGQECGPPAPKRYGTERLRHAQLRYHLARQIGRALQIVPCAARDLAEHDLFGRAPSQQHGNAIFQLAPLQQVPIVARQLLRVSKRGYASRDDRDLVHRVRRVDPLRHERVPRFVIRDDLALLRIDQTVLLFEPRNDPIRRGFNVLHLHLVLIVPRCQQCGLVQEIGEVGTHEAGRPPCNHREVDVGRENDLLCVNLEDRFAAFHVRAVHYDLAVEAAGPQQGGIQDFRTIGRRHDDHGFARIEAIHLDQKLIQRLLTLVMSTHRAADPAGLAQCVQLIDEDNARRLRLGLLEQVAHTRGTNAHEHLDELGAIDREEGHAGFPRDRAREQRLPGTRWPDQQHSFRYLGSESHELVGRLQELDDLDQLLLRLIRPGNIVERDTGARFAEYPRAILSQRHYALRRIHAPQHPEPREDDDRRRQQQVDVLAEPALRRARILHALAIEQRDQCVIRIDAHGAERLRTDARHQSVNDGCAYGLGTENHFRDLTGLDPGLELAIGNLPRARTAQLVVEQEKNRERHDEVKNGKTGTTIAEHRRCAPIFSNATSIVLFAAILSTAASFWLHSPCQGGKVCTLPTPLNGATFAPENDRLT